MLYGRKKKIIRWLITYKVNIIDNTATQKTKIRPFQHTDQQFEIKMLKVLLLLPWTYIIS